MQFNKYTHTHTHTEHTHNDSSSGNGSGDEDGNGDGNEDRIGEGGGEAEKRKKTHRGYIRDVGNGGDLGGKRKKKHRHEKVSSVAADSDNLENIKEAGWVAQGTQGLSKNCTSRESVSPLSRLSRGFRNKYH